MRHKVVATPLEPIVSINKLPGLPFEHAGEVISDSGKIAFVDPQDLGLTYIGVEAGYGSGVYPVYIRKNSFDKIVEARIYFNWDEQYDHIAFDGDVYDDPWGDEDYFI